MYVCLLQENDRQAGAVPSSPCSGRTDVISASNICLTRPSAPAIPLWARMTGTTHVFTVARLLRMYMILLPVPAPGSCIDSPRSWAMMTSKTVTISSSEYGASGAKSRKTSTMQQDASKRRSLSGLPRIFVEISCAAVFFSPSGRSAGSWLSDLSALCSSFSFVNSAPFRVSLPR